MNKKNKLNLFFRSLLFSIITFSTSVPLSFIFIIFYLPIFSNRRKNFDLVAKYWCVFILWVLKKTLNINFDIRGLNFFEKNKSYIIIGKHESTWDTLIMHTIFNPVPVFIFKKELLKVPFFGWCLNLASGIAIDRHGGINTIKQIITQGRSYLLEGHNIVIFPQGTRVLPNANVLDYPYKTGFISLIKELKVDVIPMSLNSGKIWKKKQFLKNSGTITMEFMSPIKYDTIKDLNKNEIVSMIENIIETKTIELNKI